jgi:ADP-heptose:LPS heptosyltransferase
MLLSSAQHIAIVRRNGFGDLLCSMPLFLYCLQEAPHAKISLFVDESNAPLIPYLNIPSCHEVITFPRHNKYLSILTTALKHRSKHFDIAISAKTSPMKLMNFFLYALGARERYAVVDKAWHSCFINKKALYHQPSFTHTHQALKALRLLAPNLTEVPSELWPTITIPSHVKRAYEQEMLMKIQRFSQYTSAPTLLISVTNNRETSFLGIENYSAILNELATHHDFHTIISCLPGDYLMAQELASHLNTPATIVDTSNFDMFMTLLSLVDICFIGDGGIMHMAAALDKHQVVLFGSTSPEEWSPLSNKTSTLFSPHHVQDIPHEDILSALTSHITSIINKKDV